MRTVAAVVALLACVHAGLWALAKSRIDAPDFMALKPFEDITTQSIGIGFGRKVTVRRKDQLLPTLPQAS